MGTGAVTGHLATGVSEGQGQQRSSRNRDMSCENCMVGFSIFKRKKTCYDCGRYHCSACLLRESGRTTNQRRCSKCKILSSGNFKRPELMQLKIKDLRQFLLLRNIPVHRCTEKNDLVDLIMRHCGSESYRLEQEEHHRRVQELLERRQREDFSLSEQPSSAESSSSPAPSPRLPRDSAAAADNTAQDSSHPSSQNVPPDPRHNAEPMQESRSSPMHSTEEGDSGPAENDTSPAVNDTSPAVNDTSPAVNDTSPAASSPEEGEGDGPRVTIEDVGEEGQEEEILNELLEEIQDETLERVPSNQRTKLTDIKVETDIEKLTVRQLKEVLACNFVDYKGCCEKWELMERVNRLWSADQENKHKVEVRKKSNPEQGETGLTPPAGAAESEVCKICMDAMIDCVLLECGHMVSCTECGKRLSECPICRQYVVRAVHIFRA